MVSGGWRGQEDEEDDAEQREHDGAQHPKGHPPETDDSHPGHQSSEASSDSGLCSEEY